MEPTEDAYGKQLLAEYQSGSTTAEIIEREDNYIDTGSHPGLYFSTYEQWSELEKQALEFATGKILDIGCGAGRHAVYFQEKGFDVTGMDNSPGAIEVCRLRGVKNAVVRGIAEVDAFEPGYFDTILMLGNNFGLFGDLQNAKLLLDKLARITSDDARIIGGSRNPYITNSPDHLDYHQFNRQRGRMGGQVRMRVRYGRTVGPWFDYLLVSPEEMDSILQGTGWHITKIIQANDDANYYGVISRGDAV